MWFALRTMAMGDINATTFAQTGHLQLLRDADALPDDTVFPRKSCAVASVVAAGVNRLGKILA